MGIKTRLRILRHYIRNADARKRVPFNDFKRAMFSPGANQDRK
jgi:hypothetical protein